MKTRDSLETYRRKSKRNLQKVNLTVSFNIKNKTLNTQIRNSKLLKIHPLVLAKSKPQRFTILLILKKFWSLSIRKRNKSTNKDLINLFSTKKILILPNTTKDSNRPSDSKWPKSKKFLLGISSSSHSSQSYTALKFGCLFYVREEKKCKIKNVRREALVLCTLRMESLSKEYVLRKKI